MLLLSPATDGLALARDVRNGRQSVRVRAEVFSDETQDFVEPTERLHMVGQHCRSAPRQVRERSRIAK